VTWQLNCCGVPSGTKKLLGTIASLTGAGCGTVIVDVVFRFADDARIVALPGASADTNPEELTVAIDGESELHWEAAVRSVVL
jgi:hypothetical protein